MLYLKEFINIKFIYCLVYYILFIKHYLFMFVLLKVKQYEKQKQVQ